MHHDRFVRDLQLDPDGLRAAADDLARALDTLDSTPPDPGVEEVLARLPDGARLAAEHERLLVTISRVTVELAELRTTLRHAAAALEAADLHIADELRRAGARW